MRVLVRPQGERPASTAERSPSARRIKGWCRSNEVTTTSPTSPSATGSPVPGRTISSSTSSFKHHALARRRLVGDEAEIGGGIGLVGVDAAALDLRLQRRREGRAAHGRLLDRGDILAGGGRRIEQDFQKIRRAGIGHGLQMPDHFELLLGIAGPGRDHRTADRARAGIQHHAARHQMIGKRVQHYVALAEAGGE